MSTVFAPGALLHDHDRWDDDPSPRMLRCARIVARTPHISTFEFVSDDRRALPRAAGQYVTVSADIDGERVSRCYTVSSPPTRPYSVQLTVKREADGVFSRWLHDTLQVGDRLELSGPAGEFSTAFHPADRVLLLAAGVGITPMIAVLEALHDLGDGTDAVLLHNSHDPESVVFARELEALANGNDTIRVVQAVSVDPAGTWAGPVGRLDADMLTQHVPDLTTREVFVCGPDAYMQHAVALLEELGVPAERIHVESFVLAEIAPPEVNDTAGAPGHTVSFARSGKSVVIAEGETVLQAAKQVGIRIMTSCQNGLCGTCKIVKIAGEVDIAHNGGIRQREIDAGKILACCSRPKGPVEVDV